MSDVVRFPVQFRDPPPTAEAQAEWLRGFLPPDVAEHMLEGDTPDAVIEGLVVELVSMMTPDVRGEVLAWLPYAFKVRP